LTSNDRAVLRKFLDDYTNNGGFYPSEAAMLAGQMRRSLGRLINAAGFPGWNGRRWLNSAAKTMLEAMLTRAHRDPYSALRGNCDPRPKGNSIFGT
jgi:hypothetical protein